MPTRQGVLNLAGNFLPNIFNLDGLVSLTELPRVRIEQWCRQTRVVIRVMVSTRGRCVSNVYRNIRRNSISTTAGVDQASVIELGSCRAALRVGGHQVPQLQRLFASHNNIVLHEVRPLQTPHSTAFLQLSHRPGASAVSKGLRSSKSVMPELSMLKCARI